MTCKLKVVCPCPRIPDYKIKNCDGKTLWVRHEGLGSGSMGFGRREQAQKYIDSGKINGDLEDKKVFWR